MSDTEGKFEDFARQIKFDDTPDYAHRDRLENELLCVLKDQQRRQDKPFFEIWRPVMKTRIAKLTAAAAIILIAALAITFFEKSTPTAWAIDQTIEALERFNAVHISGIVAKDGLEHSFDLWARANEDHTQSADFCLQLDNGEIRAVKEYDTYHYDPNTNTVRIIRGQKASLSPWIGPDLFRQLEVLTQDWEVWYGTDAATGRDRAFVTCSYQNATLLRYWWFEFDTETKLPVRFKQWHKLNREGKPDFDAQLIVYYENLPDKQFEFEIPEGAEVIDNWPDVLDKLDDPNSGMPTEGLTQQQACAQISQQYWQAVIDGDWVLVAKLRPLTSAEQWQYKYGKNPPEELVDVGEPYEQEGCTLGLVTPCTVKFADASIQEIKMIIKLRELDGAPSCVIAGTWGKE